MVSLNIPPIGKKVPKEAIRKLYTEMLYKDEGDGFKFVGIIRNFDTWNVPRVSDTTRKRVTKGQEKLNLESINDGIEEL